MYDTNNVFAKILRGEIPCKKVYENDFVLAFHDINPRRKVHVLVIPKGEYISFADFSQNASVTEIHEYVKATGHIARDILKLQEGGYRLIMNSGVHGGQEVPHFHTHILGGEPVGAMVNQKTG